MDAAEEEKLHTVREIGKKLIGKTIDVDFYRTAVGQLVYTCTLHISTYTYNNNKYSMDYIPIHIPIYSPTIIFFQFICSVSNLLSA